MLKYEPQGSEVQLVVDRGYREGEPITVWFGPQPNQRAFLNYGIVDEDNPHDKMTLEARIIYSFLPAASATRLHPGILCMDDF